MAQRNLRKHVATMAADEPVPLRPPGALAVSLLERTESGRPLVYVAEDATRLGDIADILRGFAPDLPVAIYPEWDCLPHDRTSPSRAVMGARAGVLRWLTDEANLPAIVLTTAPALIQRVPPAATWADARVELRVGGAFNADELTASFRGLGYILDERVDEPGEIALRGRTLDVFPAAAPYPCRVEHDGVSVTAIRSYDPLSQRSLAEADTLVIDPASEIVLPAGSDEARPRSFAGEEHKLASFYPALSTVLDYVPHAAVILSERAAGRAEAFFEQIAEGRANAKLAPGQNDKLYVSADEWRRAVDSLHLADAVAEDEDTHSVPTFTDDPRPLAFFTRFLRERLRAGDRVLLTGAEADLSRLVRAAEKAGDRQVEPVSDWDDFARRKRGTIASLACPLESGFRVPGIAATVVATADLGFATARAVRTGLSPAAMLGDVELHAGDVAVDRDHGLCVFEGLEPLTIAGEEPSEALRLRFAGERTLLVPVSQSDRIWRYGSDPDAVHLDKLESGTSAASKGATAKGTTSWGKRRLEAEAGIARTARALVEIAGERDKAEAEVLRPPGREMERFAAGFGFRLTPDQTSAIDGALDDLASGRPMDRLVCGDVGFGKTEVALRAAAAALFAGRQVAVVAPTTVLVRQHVATFARRFARFGIEVAHLSRLVSPSEAKRVKAGLSNGSIRLVIGTHALAGKGVAFHDLGLTIIDEEQRFGSKIKEQIRALGGQQRFGHVLTLTATPIPRTLQGALAGLQSLSVIATPPSVRQPVRTIVSAYDDDVVRVALEREKARGGQSFVVCPRIEDIEPMRVRLAALLPDLDITVAHGGMKPAEMDERTVAFAEGDADVLLATTIIESGLDVPRANTMLVWNAEQFGLAQLHQLRGRVGRGQRRGVVYLLSDPDRPLSPAAEKRLRTLEAFDRLGAGFAISARDLDARGAGNLVGDTQAGHAERIGLGLYQHLLVLALHLAHGEPAEDWSPDLQVGPPGGIPASYIPEPEIRLGLHQRLLRAIAHDDLDALRSETEDRFGPLPQAVENLFAHTQLRLGCRQLGIAKLAAGPKAVAADFRGLPAYRPEGDGLIWKEKRALLGKGSTEPTECVALATELLGRLREVEVA